MLQQAQFISLRSMFFTTNILSHCFVLCTALYSTELIAINISQYSSASTEEQVAIQVECILHVGGGAGDVMQGNDWMQQ